MHNSKLVHCDAVKRVRSVCDAYATLITFYLRFDSAMSCAPLYVQLYMLRIGA